MATYLYLVFVRGEPWYLAQSTRDTLHLYSLHTAIIILRKVGLVSAHRVLCVCVCVCVWCVSLCVCLWGRGEGDVGHARVHTHEHIGHFVPCSIITGQPVLITPKPQIHNPQTQGIMYLNPKPQTQGIMYLRSII